MKRRTDRQSALRLVQTIDPPIDLVDIFGDGTTGLLVQERHPVGKAQEANWLVFRRCFGLHVVGPLEADASAHVGDGIHDKADERHRAARS